MCKHINCKQHTKKFHQNYHYQKRWDTCLKKYQKSSWKVLENLETDTKSKESKSRTKKYGETRAAA